MFPLLDISGYAFGWKLYYLIFKCAIVNAAVLGIMSFGIVVGAHLAWSLW